MIDITKVVKGDLMLVRDSFENRYMVGEVIGISPKHNKLSFKYGDYGCSYNVKLEDCKPYEHSCYKPAYIKVDGGKV